jgi:hypothetical protein
MIPPSASQPARKHIGYIIVNSNATAAAQTRSRIMLYNGFKSIASV